jgi:hypothetical protein
MKINDSYVIVRREDEILLTNIEDGDVYRINDVTAAIFEACESFDTVGRLAAEIYASFESDDEDYGMDELIEFIDGLISDGFILAD